MYDIAIHYSVIAEKKSSIMDRIQVSPKKYILATIHRAENTDDFTRLNAIFQGLEKVGREIPVVLPLHPRTRQALKSAGLLEKMDGSIRLIDPVGYLDMVMLEKNALLIATDSGGVQKEAFFYRVPCVTLRDETEWVELVDLGWNRVIRPDDSSKIANEILSALDSRGDEGTPYGEGRAAETVFEILSDVRSRI
jgi:UDP-GlcNAc3NAcA epimerase